MMIEKKKKKKRIVVEQTPIFDHSLKDFNSAIGLPDIGSETKKKMAEIGKENPNITKLSEIVEVFYENFNKIELATILARSIGNSTKSEVEDKEEEQF